MKPIALILALAPLPALAQPSASTSTRPTLVPIPASAAMRVGKMFEARLDNIPLQSANPFDPDSIAVDVTFSSPLKKTLSIPAFWYRPYSRALRATGAGSQARESEVLLARGEGEWRVRWTPREGGAHAVRISVRRGAGTPSTSTASPSTWSALQVLTRDKSDLSSRGFVRLNPRNRRYLQLEDGTPLPLLGENLCWHGARGTFDYDDWLAGFRRGRMNYARLWMHNGAFSPEFFPGERGKYNLERLWQLDYVLDLARASGVNVMLCLDYHGIFQTQKDMWGGNDWWTRHAYHKNGGGPLEEPNDFFTDEAAQVLYRKRLRYLVARYSAFSNLLSWQFFNEINNVYGDAKKAREENRSAQRLHPPDVVAWHDRQSKYLGAIDPYKHLITTSFGSAGEQAEMWRLPGMSYANWHWYGNWSGKSPGVLGMAREVGSRFPRDYAKPVVISEFGTDGRSSSPESDPFRRGLRQAIWGGVFVGTAGTSAPWWWEKIHADNLYPMWASLRAFLPRNFASAAWRPRAISAPAFVAETQLNEVDANGAAFDEAIPLLESWGARASGPAILNRAGQSEFAALNGFVHGSSKPDLRSPLRVLAHLKEGARLVLRLNAVADDAILVVKQNGREVLRRALPNKDGGYAGRNEYDEDIAVPLSVGRAEIEVENAGGDWLLLTSIRVEGALPTRARAKEVALEAFALSDGVARGASTLVYAVDAGFSWPRGRTEAARMTRGSFVTLPNVVRGEYEVQWWSPAKAQVLGTRKVRVMGPTWKLEMPAFEVDVAARIKRTR